MAGYHKRLSDGKKAYALQPGWAGQNHSRGHATAQRAVERLETASPLKHPLKQAGRARRDRVYWARQIMAVLDEPPKLAAWVWSDARVT